MENSGRFKTYHANSWGLSAGDGPHGYATYGSTPCKGKPRHDGTISIYAALSCLPFIPDETMALVDYLYHQQPCTWGAFGFFDAYNLDVSPAWCSKSLYGIDKGCSMIMIENYLSGLIWKTYTGSDLIQKSLEILQFTKNRSIVDEQILCKRQSVLAGRQPVFIQAGEFHYFRTPRAEWRQRLELLKQAGFNAVASYIPWLWHQVEEDLTDLDGHSHSMRDLAGFWIWLQKWTC